MSPHPSLSRAARTLLAALRTLLLVLGMFAALGLSPVFAAPTLRLTLQLAPGTPTPVPSGAPYRYRLTYECSSSLAGDECLDLRVTSQLAPGLEALDVIGNADVEVASYNPVTGTATWQFASPLPLGTTGQLEFEIRYKPGVTLNGQTGTITSTISAGGVALPSLVTTTPPADARDNSTVSKTLVGGGAAGDTSVYRISVCPGGNGSLNLNNVTVTDTLPLEGVFLSADPAPTSVSGRTVVWTGLSAQAPSCQDITLSVDYPAGSNSVGESRSNSATATGTLLNGVVKTMAITRTHTLASPLPGLQLEKSADADTIVGATVTTTLRVRNIGNVGLANGEVSDPIPNEYDVISFTTGLATAVAYQKNGGTTWVTDTLALPATIAVADLAGFDPATDYISGLRFALGAMPVGFDDDGITIVSRVLNPPHGGAAYILSPTQSRNVLNTATARATHNGVPIADTQDGATTQIAVPKARPTPLKVITVGNPSQPRQKVTYRVQMANGSFRALDNPVFADLLPAQVTYNDSFAQVLTGIPAGCAAPTFTKTDNYQGSGRTLLRWSWDSPGCAIPAGEGPAVEFQVVVKPGTLPTGASSIGNRLALVDYTTDTNLVRTGNCSADAAIVEKGFLDNEYDPAKLCFSDPSGLRISAAASIGSEKLVKGQLDSAFHKDPRVGQTVRSGLITYQMVLTNTGNVTWTNLLIVDVLPYADGVTSNLGTRDLANVGTAWTPRLTGPVVVSPPVPGLEIYYSSELNPCRPNLTASTNPGCTPMVVGTVPGPGVWSKSLPSDPSAVRSLQFMFGSYNLPPNDAVRFTFNMFAPPDAPLAAAGANGTLGNNDDLNVAWNTFAYEAVRTDDGTRLVAQPPRVGIEVVDAAPLSLASYGNYVWNDEDQDGAQDEALFRGLNGVTVRLYGDADGDSVTTGDQALVGTQITGDDGAGNPGYYRFAALPAGNYFAEFVAPAGFELTQEDADAEESDSDALAATLHVDPTTGRAAYYTPITPLGAGQDDPSWDAGFYAPPVSLGNRVFFDTNNDGLDNDSLGGLSGSSTGVAGVTVTLFLDANGDGYLTGLEQSALATTTTDVDGLYLFTRQTHDVTTTLAIPGALYPAQYIVGIPTQNFTVTAPLNGYYSSETSLTSTGVFTETAAPDPDTGRLVATTDDDRDRDDNGDTVVAGSAFYAGGVLSKPIFVGASEPTGEPGGAGTTPGGAAIADALSNLTVDFGFSTTAFGNLVWDDNGAGGGTRVNGVRDGGESGIAGASLTLWSQHNGTQIRVGPDGRLGTADDGTAALVTPGDGSYFFAGLPAGRYVVRLTAPTGYVSTRDVGTTVNPNTTPTDEDDNGINSGTTATSGTNNNSLNMLPATAMARSLTLVNHSAGAVTDPSLDFGVARTYSLGNRVWLDANNSGALDSGEPGVQGVVLDLFLADGVTPARTIANGDVPTRTTDVNGFYRFDDLPAGDYVVVVLASNFASGGVLEGAASSTGALGVYEPAPDPEGDLNNDDSGTHDAATGTVRSLPITLGEGPTEPLNDGDTPSSLSGAPDSQSNRTVDFGFFRPLTLGNLVWEDVDNSGVKDVSESGLDDVVVRLYDATGTAEIPVGPDGTLGTADDAAGGVLTRDGGQYRFTGLLTGTYVVALTPPAGYQSSTGDSGAYEPAPDADADATDGDDNGALNAAVLRSQPVDLAHNGEPTGEPALPAGLPSRSTDSSSNLTVDFGLFRPLSLGNLVWLDGDNSGVRDGVEGGIADVWVRLYRDRDGDGLPDDLRAPAGYDDGDAIRAMQTNGAGRYLFTGLGAGDYIVEAATPAGHASSTGQSLAPLTVYEGSGRPDPDTITATMDEDDSGTAVGAVARAKPVTLTYDAEPTGEDNAGGLFDPTTPDASGNYTVDFGFYEVVSLGNLVWDDRDNDGLHAAGTEPGLGGVTVELFRDNDGDGDPDDLNGAPGADVLASTTTSPDGHYLFAALSAGRYIVAVTPPVGYGSSTGAPIAPFPYEDAATWPDPEAATVTDGDDNGLASGGKVWSLPITLATGAEPAGEPPAPTLGDGTPDTSANYTLDFGLFRPVSLGNLVWVDADNSGRLDGAEAGYALGTTVSLYLDGDGDGTPDDLGGAAGPDALATTTTSADGHYLFAGLRPGRYIVAVDLPAGFLSSTGALVAPLPYEDAATWPDPDAAVIDGDDNGLTSDGKAWSQPVTLSGGAEPTGEPPAPTLGDSTPDAHANYTLDFGLFTPVSLGNLAFEDVNDDGQFVPAHGDVALAGVTLALYDAGGNPVTEDASGLPLGPATTGLTGLYAFANLRPGAYTVEAVPPAGFYSSTDPAVPPNPDANADGDDNGLGGGTSARSAQITLTVGGEPAGDGDGTSGNTTLDVGFYAPLSLGDLVFADADNSGRYDPASDAPLAGATVELRMATGGAVTDAAGNPVGPQTTGADGRYLFERLRPGSYTVRVTPPAGYVSSDDGAYAVFPDQDHNDDDNGPGAGPTVTSGAVALRSRSEPVDDGDASSSSNLSVDFGFFKPVSLGNLVFEDFADDGVFDGADVPLAGAAVGLYSADGATPATDLSGAMVATQTTGADGLYLFANLRPGTYVVRTAGPEGYASSTDLGSTAHADDDVNDDDNGQGEDATVASTAVTLISGGEPADDGDGDVTSNLSVDFGFFRPAALGDLVWLDRNRDGLQGGGADEPGVPGIRVELWRDGGATAIMTTTTDAGGRYRFDRLPAGAYFVHFAVGDNYDYSPQGGGDPAASDPNDSDADEITGVTAVTTLDPGEDDLTWDAGIHYAAGLGNRVWLDRDADGVQGGAEPGVPDVEVTLRDGAGALIATDRTDSDGFYGFRNLPAGTYQVHVALPDGYRFSPRDRDARPDADSDVDPTTGLTSLITLAAGAADPTWDAGLYQLVSLGDQVWEDTDNDGLTGGDERGLDGVPVALFADRDGDGSPDGATAIVTTTTGAGGRYRFDALTPGGYVVEVAPPAAYRTSTGTVGSASGTYEPAPGPDDDREGDDNGTAVGGKVRSGAVTLWSLAEPGAAVDGDGTNGNLSVDFGFFRPASLGSTVWYDRDGDGRQGAGEPGVPGVTVTLYASDGTPVRDLTGQPLRISTDGAGSYLFTNLTPGSYFVGFTGLPGGYTFTVPGVGEDDGDSDAHPVTGLTAAVTLRPGDQNLTLWAGLINPTAISLISFTAEREGAGVALRWETGAEWETWGFHILRSSDGARGGAVRVTPVLIVARGGPQLGAVYTWHDPAAPAGAVYWLEEVAFGGATHEYGPVRPRAGTTTLEPRIFLPSVGRSRER